MNAFLLVLRVMGAGLAGVVRYAFRGPRHPDWGFAMDAQVSLYRASFGQIAPMGAVRYRQATDRLAPMQTGGVPWRAVDDAPVGGHWLEPDDADDGLVLVYFHGGGFIFGSVRSHGLVIGALATAARARVFVPDYRLAPDHPLPAAHEDGEAAVRWLVDHEGIDPARIVVVGDSAGGNLVFATLLRLRDHGGPRIAGGVALSPWVDLSNSGASFQAHADTDYCTWEACNEAARNCVGDADPRSPALSPRYADLTGLPPIRVQVGEVECLVDQVLALGEAAKTQHADVAVEVFPAMVHCWHLLGDATPETGRAIDRIAAHAREWTA